MEDYIFDQNDFNSAFNIFSSKFNIYSNRIVLEVSFYPSPPQLFSIYSVNIKNIVIKKSIIFSFYGVYLEIEDNEKMEGYLDAPSPMLVTSGLDENVAIKLRDILFAIKSGTNHENTKHSYENSLEYKYEKTDKAINFVFDVVILKILKICICFSVFFGVILFFSYLYLK